MNYQDAGVLSLLKKALKSPFKNTLFTSSVILTSFPIFLLMIYLELHFERTSTAFLNSLTSNPYSESFWWSVISYFFPKLENKYSYQDQLIILPFLPLIYLFLLHVLDFLAAILIIGASSNIHKNDPECETMILRDIILQQSMISKRDRLKGSFVTCFFVLFVSTSLSSGWIAFFLSYYSICVDFYWLIFALVYLPAFVKWFPKYLEMNAVWNMSLVVSVLEEVHGIDAISVSFRLCKGNEMVGRKLMLVFLAFGFGPRISRVFVNDGVVGVIGRTSLLWLGILMKWVVFVMYYYHCKQSKGVVAQIDEEMGGTVTRADGLDENHKRPHEKEAKLGSDHSVKVIDTGLKQTGAVANFADYKDKDSLNNEISHTAVSNNSQNPNVAESLIMQGLFSQLISNSKDVPL